MSRGKKVALHLRWYVARLVSAVYDRTIINRAKAENRQLNKLLTNLTWAWEERAQGTDIRKICEENEVAIFEAGQSQWVPYSEAHRKYKKKHGYDMRILVMTNNMRLAATNSQSPENISFGTAENFYYGVNAEAFRDFGGWSYPEIHQFIGDRRGVVRRFLFWTVQGREKALAWFGEVVRKKEREVLRAHF